MDILKNDFSDPTANVDRLDIFLQVQQLLWGVGRPRQVSWDGQQFQDDKAVCEAHNDAESRAGKGGCPGSESKAQVWETVTFLYVTVRLEVVLIKILLYFLCTCNSTLKYDQAL